MKKTLTTLTLITITIILAIQTQSLTLHNINITTTDNSTITFDRNTTCDNITITNTSIIITNLQFNETYYDATGVTNTTNINWNQTQRRIRTSDFLNKFRFYDSLTSTYDSNYTFGPYQPITEQLRILYSNHEEGLYNWTYTGTEANYLTFTEELNWTYNTHYDVTYDITKNKITLTFQQNGTLTQTAGRTTDENKTFGFNTSQLVIPLANLTAGYVYTRFNMQSGTNHSQYYEFINDYSNVSDTLELLATEDYSIHFEVSDAGKSPLKDVLVRAYQMEYQNNIWVEKDLIGQRLTTEDGITFFILQADTEMFYSFTKDGYETERLIITTGDESFTRDNPVEIRMQETTPTTQTTQYILTNQEVTTETTHLPVVVYATGYETIELQTNVRQAAGLAPLDITNTQDILDTYTYNLAATDFSTTQGFTNILWILGDNSIIEQATLPPVRKAEYNNTLFTFPTLTDKTPLNIMLLIAVIIISAIIGLSLRNPNAGLTSLTLGFIFISYISGIYWIAIAIIVTYAGVGILKKAVLEKE